MFEKRSTRRKPRHYFSAQYVEKLAGSTLHRDFEVGVGATERLVIEKAEGRRRDVTDIRCALFVAMEEEEIGLDFIFRDLVRRATVVAGELVSGGISLIVGETTGKISKPWRS